MTKAAEIPVTIDRGFITVAASINNKPVTMIVDTGAEGLLVTPSAMASLALSADRHRRTTIQGTGGSIATQNAALQSFGIGTMEMLDQSASVGPLPAEGPALHASGLIGTDWLSDFDVEFDLPHHRMALYRVHGCADGYIPWSGPSTSVRVQLYGRGLPLVPVKLDGQPLTALLDSGAVRSSIGRTAAEHMGLTQAKLAADPRARSSGVDGAQLESYLHRFGELQVAEAHETNPALLVSNLHVRIADMLLGADWLQHNRVWIAYGARKVTIQPAQP